MGLKPDFENKLLILNGKNIATAQLEISVQITQNVATNLSTIVALWPLATTLMRMANILPLPFKTIYTEI